MKKLFIIALVFSFLFPVKSIFAQSSSESIRSFSSNIQLSPDNVATVTEVIVYDFGSNSRRGIYREIPLVTKAGDSGKYFYYDLEWKGAKQDGKPAEIQIQDSDEQAVIRIGNPDIYLRGSHTYIISYKLWPIAIDDEDGDFINLNITGTQWMADIKNAKATITLEPGNQFLDSRCYSGIAGSTSQNCDISITGNRLEASATNLGSYQGLTINALTNKGAFTNYQYPQDPPPVDLRPVLLVLVGLFALLLGIGLKIYRFVSIRSRRKDQTIIPIYTPPKDLSVGEMGLLHDNTSNMNEITAMLIQLAVDGYIKIENTKKKGWFTSPEYKFHKLKPYSGNNENFKKLYDLLFSGSKNSVVLSSVSKTKASKTVSNIKKNLVKALEDKDFRYKDSAGPLHKKIAKLYKIMSLFIIAITIFYIFKLVAEQSSIVPAIVSGIGALVLTLFGYLFSKDIELSPSGYKKWGEIEGLIMYLTVAEKDRLKFHNVPEMNVDHFSELLPSAVALGVDSVWAKQFKHLDVGENIDWYSGPGRFNTIALSHSLSHDLNSAINSSFSAPSQSSGGFSGGGFSGGGAGGGGGGSW